MSWVFRAAVPGSIAIHIALMGAGAFLGRPSGPEAPPAAPATDKANLVGDTIDVNEEGDQSGAGDTSTTPATAAANDFEIETPTPAKKPDGRGAPTARAGARTKAKAGTSGATSDTKGEGGEAGLFGAVGERGAVDLATAFTRQFPQAASADSAWATVPFGVSGETDVILTLDAAGKLTGVQVSPGAPASLKNGIDRTITLIRGRPFTSPGARTRLHVRTTVSPDQVHDGLHGQVFAIGGSFSHAAAHPGTGEGSAFFALAIGRRIDIRVQAR